MLWSCKTEFQSEDEILKYITDPDKGLIKEFKEEKIDVTVSYKPSQLLVMQELVGGSRSNPDSLKNEFGKYLYFRVTMSYDGYDLETAYGRRKKMSKGFQDLFYGYRNLFRLQTQSDTLEAADYFYSRVYGLARESVFLVAFKKESVQKSDFLNFIIKENEFFDKKEFLFKTKDIENMPDLNWNDVIKKLNNNNVAK